MDYVKMTGEQAKILTNATQIFDRHRRQDGRFEGSMHWKHISNRDYLYRGFSGGRSKSLGPRTPETEEIKRCFDAGRAEHRQRSKALTDQIKIHADYIKVNRLNRFPSAGARIIRSLERAKIPHRVIGTSALYAYEVSAGVLFLPEQLATEDAEMVPCVTALFRSGIRRAGHAGPNRDSGPPCFRVAQMVCEPAR